MDINENFKKVLELQEQGVARTEIYKICEWSSLETLTRTMRKRGYVYDKFITNKSIEAKELIKKYSKDFEGLLSGINAMKIIGISRNSYYKYKKQLIQEYG